MLSETERKRPPDPRPDPPVYGVRPGRPRRGCLLSPSRSPITPLGSLDYGRIRNVVAVLVGSGVIYEPFRTRMH